MDIKRISLTVNGKEYNLLVGDDSIEGVIPNSEVLVKTLRNRLNLTGTKDACEEGACGCCTVIMNGDPVTSCMILTADCDGAEITTIEGLEDAITGEQYTAKNIITYQVKNSNITGDNKGRQDFDNIGSGVGYYITNGYAVEINWKKDSRESQTVYTYKDGSEIVVNDGNTYIQIQPMSQTLTISE